MVTINGLPAHPFLIHLVIVLLPAASLMAILGSLWPAAQRKFTFLTPLVALIGMIMVPITVSAGEQLATEMGIGAAVAEHEKLAKRILPFAIALFITTVVQWAYQQFGQSVPHRRWLTALIALLVIASAVATTVQVALAGDAGARVVWSGIGTLITFGLPVLVGESVRLFCQWSPLSW